MFDECQGLNSYNLWRLRPTLTCLPYKLVNLPWTQKLTVKRQRVTPLLQMFFLIPCSYEAYSSSTGTQVPLVEWLLNEWSNSSAGGFMNSYLASRRLPDIRECSARLLGRCNQQM